MEWRSYIYLFYTVLSRCTYGTFIGSEFAVVKVEGLFIKISFDNNIYSNTYSSSMYTYTYIYIYIPQRSATYISAFFNLWNIFRNSIVYLLFSEESNQMGNFSVWTVRHPAELNSSIANRILLCLGKKRSPVFCFANPLLGRPLVAC